MGAGKNGLSRARFLLNAWRTLAKLRNAARVPARYPPLAKRVLDLEAAALSAAPAPDLSSGNWGLSMNLSAPTQVVFLISLVLAVLAILGLFVRIPFISLYAFWVLAAAYVVLAIGCLFKGR